MANVINKYTQHHKSAIDRQMAKYDKYIKRLKYERAQGKKEYEKCASQIEAQAHTIQELQDREALMADQIRSHENESAMAEARTQQIKDKYYMVKGVLNAAIEEQQHLYTKAKMQCESSIIEIRAMEKCHKSSIELAVEKAETARVQMLEKVKQVIAEANVEEQGLREQIKSAHQQLEQKTAELERQQNENRVLSKRLQSVKTETNGLESLVAQNKEILENWMNNTQQTAIRPTRWKQRHRPNSIS
ncbi:hypothetical protein B0T18DRAFT_182357 [Schizothecium vesticola]|uniref:Uncharacterized protein n=1 Tax=Schizothecium vesticola TaxID=314040 RepID=A0AA40EPZ8_9PEZI|nr:hypothetical protein B0T18DRAFT_182357 [Schizothecium vesticola]